MSSHRFSTDGHVSWMGGVSPPIQDLMPELAEQLGYDNDDQGVVISDVTSGSPSAKAGLRRGDLILEVNRTPVSSLQDYRESVSSVGTGESILLLVKRGENTLFVVVNPEEEESSCLRPRLSVGNRGFSFPSHILVEIHLG